MFSWNIHRSLNAADYSTIRAQPAPYPQWSLTSHAGLGGICGACPLNTQHLLNFCSE